MSEEDIKANQNSLSQKLLDAYARVSEFEPSGAYYDKPTTPSRVNLYNEEEWKPFTKHAIVKDYKRILNIVHKGKDDANNVDEKYKNLKKPQLKSAAARAIGTLKAAIEKELSQVARSSDSPNQSVRDPLPKPQTPVKKLARMSKMDAKHIVGAIRATMSEMSTSCQNESYMYDERVRARQGRRVLQDTKSEVSKVKANIKNLIKKLDKTKSTTKKSKYEASLKENQDKLEDLQDKIEEVQDAISSNNAKANAKLRSCMSLKQMTRKFYAIKKQEAEKEKFNKRVEKRTVKQNSHDVYVISQGKREVANIDNIKKQYIKQAWEDNKREELYKPVTKRFWLKHAKYGNLESMEDAINDHKKALADAQKQYESELRRICEGSKDNCMKNNDDLQKLKKNNSVLKKTAKNARVIKDWGVENNIKEVTTAVNELKTHRSKAHADLRAAIQKHEQKFLKKKLTAHNLYVQSRKSELKIKDKTERAAKFKEINSEWKNMSAADKKQKVDEAKAITYYSLMTPSSIFADRVKQCEYLNEYTRNQKYFFTKVYRKPKVTDTIQTRNAKFKEWATKLTEAKKEEINTYFKKDKLDQLFTEALNYKTATHSQIEKGPKYEGSEESLKLLIIRKYIEAKDKLWSTKEAKEVLRYFVNKDRANGLMKFHQKALENYYKSLVSECDTNASQVHDKYLLPQKLHFMRIRKGKKPVSNKRAWMRLALKLPIMNGHKCRAAGKVSKSFMSKSIKGRQLLESKNIYAMYPLPEVNHSWVEGIGPHLLYRRVGELMIPVNLDTAQTILKKASDKSSPTTETETESGSESESGSEPETEVLESIEDLSATESE